MSDKSDSKRLRRACTKLMNCNKMAHTGKKIRYAELVGAIELVNSILPAEWRYSIAPAMKEMIRHLPTEEN
jgi:hypothetical protein